MSKFVVAFLSSLTASVAVFGAAGSAQAQVYVDGGYAGIYAGTRVQVYTADGGYDAVVLQVSGPSVLVRYLDSAWGADQWVDASQLSVVGSVQAVGYQPGIQVYWGSRWYDGTLLATRGNRYQVRYHGRTEWIGADRWHHHGRSSYRAPAYGSRNHGGGHAYNRGRGNGRGHEVGGRHDGGRHEGGRGGGRDNGGRQGNGRGHGRGH